MKRNLTIDVIKGIGILLVVLGHAIQKNVPDYLSNPLFNIIYSFHMPLFFVISGYLLYKTVNGSWVSGIKNKVVYLIIPHICFNIFYYFASYTGFTIYENFPAQYSFIIWLRESLVFTSGEWFLWVLFITFLLMLAIDKVGRKFNHIVFWMVAFLITGLLLFLPDTVKDYFRLFEIEWYFIFIFIGYIAAKYNIFINNSTRLLFLLSILYFVFMYWTNWSGGWVNYAPRNLLYYIHLGTSHVYLERFLQAFLGIAMTIFVSLMITKSKPLSAAFAWLGRISLGVYLFHMLLSGLGVGSGWVLVATSFLFSLALAIMLTYLCSRIPPIKRIWLKGAFMRESEPENSTSLL